MFLKFNAHIAAPYPVFPTPNNYKRSVDMTCMFYIFSIIFLIINNIEYWRMYLKINITCEQYLSLTDRIILSILYTHALIMLLFQCKHHHHDTSISYPYKSSYKSSSESILLTLSYLYALHPARFVNTAKEMTNTCPHKTSRNICNWLIKDSCQIHHKPNRHTDNVEMVLLSPN